VKQVARSSYELIHILTVHDEDQVIDLVYDEKTDVWVVRE
jgi:hypothetical protein